MTKTPDQDLSDTKGTFPLSGTVWVSTGQFGMGNL